MMLLEGLIDQTDDTSFSKSYISLNTFEVIEAHLLNICFDLKTTLSQCAAVFIINKEQEQAQEKRLEGHKRR